LEQIQTNTSNDLMTPRDITLADDSFAQRFDRSKRSFLLNPSEISTYVAYLALKTLFGLPNNLDVDTDKTQWEYRLRVSDTLIEVYDWKTNSWSIAVYTPDCSEKSGRQLAEQLYGIIEKEAQRHRSKEKAAILAPQGYVIQNPFSVYHEVADALLDQADKTAPPTNPSSRGEIEAVIAGYFANRDFCKAAFLMYLAAFEGLLNLIYELYLLPHLRDERIYDRLAREHIDIKVRLAPVYCGCFKGNAIDTDSETFKMFSRIINLRNDFVHANFTEHMKTPVIREDGHTFLLESSEVEKHGLPINFSSVEIEHARRVRANIAAMTEMLADQMKPRYRSEFIRISQQQYVAVEIVDGEMIPQSGF
jgi:hypothetical protein